MADVVAIAQVGDTDAVQLTEPLTDRHGVGQRLQRVRRIGEPVDHRDGGVLGELLDLLLRERADQDRAHEAGEDERRVAAALAARELQVGGRHVERHSAELRDTDLRADPRSRRRFVEDQRDGAAGKNAELPAAGTLDLELVGEVERELELVSRPRTHAGVAAAFE